MGMGQGKNAGSRLDPPKPHLLAPLKDKKKIFTYSPYITFGVRNWFVKS
jgi:hypothetical protein